MNLPKEPFKYPSSRSKKKVHGTYLPWPNRARVAAVGGIRVCAVTTKHHLTKRVSRSVNRIVCDFLGATGEPEGVAADAFIMIAVKHFSRRARDKMVTPPQEVCQIAAELSCASSAAPKSFPLRMPCDSSKLLCRRWRQRLADGM